MLKIDPQDKARLIDPLYSTKPSFYLALLVLLAIIAWGVVMYVRQLVFGLGETGLNRPVYWGVYMVNFIFFIGISLAGTLISAILHVTGAEWRRPITRIAESITVFALLVAMLQIIIDMGRPDRLGLVMFYGRLQSPILWDVISVTTYLMASMMYLYLSLLPDLAILRDNSPEGGPAWRRYLYHLLSWGWRGNRQQWLRLEKAITVMAVLIIPVAVSVHTITSWILATTVQPGWHSSIFGPYFVVGAIFSGTGMIFLAMTAARWLLPLKTYITERQYRNLSLIFISMVIIWAYFTLAENMGIAAAQQVEEFPVLASKLWGQHALVFWTMVILMGFSFWILVAPQLMPVAVARARWLQPRYALPVTGTAVLALILLLAPQTLPVPVSADLSGGQIRTVLWGVLILLLTVAGLNLAVFLRGRLVLTTVIAAICVVVAMWLERWNIIVPTVTHPRLIAYTSYLPTMTEFALTAASLALFGLMLLLFFKLFPAVSIWEVTEGRVLDEAQAQIEIPAPIAAEMKRLRHWGFRR
jgi:Ni/Fe-hydrogenase subunit HybB-like protein